MVIYGIFGDAIVCYFFGAKRFVCTNFHPFCKAGVCWIHPWVVNIPWVENLPNGLAFRGKKNLKCTNVDIQLDKEDNILKNGKSSWWVEMKIICWDEKAGWVSGEMQRRHCNGERETRQSFKEECSCKQQLACSIVCASSQQCARKHIKSATPPNISPVSPGSTEHTTGCPKKNVP